MPASTAPLGFAWEADEKAFASLVNNFGPDLAKFQPPGFYFCEHGTRNVRVGVFPVIVELAGLAKGDEAFKAALESVTHAGLTRINRTQDKHKVVHREDVLQVIIQLLLARYLGDSLDKVVKGLREQFDELQEECDELRGENTALVHEHRIALRDAQRHTLDSLDAMDLEWMEVEEKLEKKCDELGKENKDLKKQCDELRKKNERLEAKAKVDGDVLWTGNNS